MWRRLYMTRAELTFAAILLAVLVVGTIFLIVLAYREPYPTGPGEVACDAIGLGEEKFVTPPSRI